MCALRSSGGISALCAACTRSRRYSYATTLRRWRRSAEPLAKLSAERAPQHRWRRRVAEDSRAARRPRTPTTTGGKKPSRPAVSAAVPRARARRSRAPGSSGWRSRSSRPSRAAAERTSLSFGSDFTMYVKRTAPAVQRCKTEQQRCSYGRDRLASQVNRPSGRRDGRLCPLGEAGAERAVGAQVRRMVAALRSRRARPRARPRAERPRRGARSVQRRVRALPDERGPRRLSRVPVRGRGGRAPFAPAAPLRANVAVARRRSRAQGARRGDAETVLRRRPIGVELVLHHSGCPCNFVPNTAVLSTSH